MDRNIVSLVLVSLACFVCVESYYNFPFADGKSYKIVSNLTVPKCDNSSAESSYCQVAAGTNKSISIDFIPKISATKLTMEVVAEVAGIPIPYPLPQPDACKSGVVCPMKAAEKQTYKNIFEVKHAYPKLKVPTRWTLKNEKGEVVFCWWIKVAIV